MPTQTNAAVQARPQLSVGIDTGGTHTDLVLVGGGMLRTLKVPTTPPPTA